MKDVHESDVVGQQGKDIVMETMIMEEVHDIIEGSCNMEHCRSDMICVQLKRTQVDLGRAQMVEDMNKALNGVVLLI